MTLTLRSKGEPNQRCRLAWKLKMRSNMTIHRGWPETQPPPTTQNSCCKYMCKEHHSPSRSRAALWSRRCLEWTSSQQRRPQCWQQCTGSGIKRKFSYCTSYTYTPSAQAACSISSRSAPVTTDNCMRMLLLWALVATASLSDWQLPEWWEVLHQTHAFMHVQEKSCTCKISPGFGSTPTLEWSDTTTTIIKHDIHCRHITTRFSNDTEGSDITTASIFLGCTIGLWCSLVLKWQ